MSDLTNRVLMGVAKANTVVSVIGIAVAFGAILHNKKVREESQRTYELCKEEAARSVCSRTSTSLPTMSLGKGTSSRKGADLCAVSAQICIFSLLQNPR